MLHLNKEKPHLFSGFKLLPLVLVAAFLCYVTGRTEVRYGESTRSRINSAMFTTIPASATDLYFLKHKEMIDSFYFIGMTIPLSEGMQFMEEMFGSFRIEEGIFQNWIDNDMGPHSYGWWHRTPLWNLGKMTKPVNAGSGGTSCAYDKESGRMLIFVARI